eukprot:6464890-Amphidinium_carterae.3
MPPEERWYREQRWSPPPLSEVLALSDGRHHGGHWKLDERAAVTIKGNSRDTMIGIAAEHAGRVKLDYLWQDEDYVSTEIHKDPNERFSSFAVRVQLASLGEARCVCVTQH